MSRKPATVYERSPCKKMFSDEYLARKKKLQNEALADENEKKNEPDGKDDFDRHDWKAETDAMEEWERNNLSISPLLRKDANGKKIPLH